MSALATNSQESALVIFVVQLEAQFVAVERHAFLDITYGKHYRVNVINHNSEATDSCYKRLTSTQASNRGALTISRACDAELSLTAWPSFITNRTRSSSVILSGSVSDALSWWWPWDWLS